MGRRNSQLCKRPENTNCPVSTRVCVMLPTQPTGTPRSRADCRIHAGKAPGWKHWGTWPENRGSLSEQPVHKRLAVGGQSSCLMAILGLSCGAWSEVVLHATLLSFSRTSSKFLCQLLPFLENSHSPLLRSGLWTLRNPKLRMPTLPLNLSSAEVASKKFVNERDLYPRSGPGKPSQQNSMALTLLKCGS